MLALLASHPSLPITEERARLFEERALESAWRHGRSSSSDGAGPSTVEQRPPPRLDGRFRTLERDGEEAKAGADDSSEEPRKAVILEDPITADSPRNGHVGADGEWILDPLLHIPGVDFLVKGYNLLYADPMPIGAGLDTGFNRYGGGNIFTLTYENQDFTSDGKHARPDHVQAHALHGCAINFDTAAISSDSDYRNYLRNLVTAQGERSGGPLYRRAYAYSPGVWKARTKLQRGNKVLASTEASCSAFMLRLPRYSQRPGFSEDFAEAVERIEELVKQLEALDGDEKEAKEKEIVEAWYDAFDFFGTHFSDTMVLGSRFGVQEWYDWDHWNEQGTAKEKQCVTSQLERRAGELTFGSEASLSLRLEDQVLHPFEMHGEMRSISVVGAAPGFDAGMWEAATRSDAMPIKFTPKPICELIGDPVDDPSGTAAQLTGSAVARKYCDEALTPEGYCAERVAVREGYNDCALKPAGFRSPAGRDARRGKKSCHVDDDCYQYWKKGEGIEDDPPVPDRKNFTCMPTGSGGDGVCKLKMTRIYDMHLAFQAPGTADGPPICEKGYVAARMLDLEGIDLGEANLNFYGEGGDDEAGAAEKEEKGGDALEEETVADKAYVIYLCMLKKESDSHVKEIATSELSQHPVCSTFMSSQHSGCQPEEDFYNPQNPGLKIAKGQCGGFNIARGVVSGLHRAAGVSRQETITRDLVLQIYNAPYGGVHGWKQVKGHLERAEDGKVTMVTDEGVRWSERNFLTWRLDRDYQQNWYPANALFYVRSTHDRSRYQVAGYRANGKGGRLFLEPNINFYHRSCLEKALRSDDCLLDINSQSADESMARVSDLPAEPEQVPYDLKQPFDELLLAKLDEQGLGAFMRTGIESRTWADETWDEFKRNYVPPLPHVPAVTWQEQPSGKAWDPFAATCPNKGGYLDQGVVGLHDCLGFKTPKFLWWESTSCEAQMPKLDCVQFSPSPCAGEDVDSIDSTINADVDVEMIDAYTHMHELTHQRGDTAEAKALRERLGVKTCHGKPGEQDVGDAPVSAAECGVCTCKLWIPWKPEKQARLTKESEGKIVCEPIREWAQPPDKPEQLGCYQEGALINSAVFTMGHQETSCREYCSGHNPKGGVTDIVVVADSGGKCPPGYSRIRNVERGGSSDLNEGWDIYEASLFLCQSFTVQGVQPDPPKKEEVDKKPPTPGSVAAMLVGIKVDGKPIDKELLAPILERLKKDWPEAATTEAEAIEAILDEVTTKCSDDEANEPTGEPCAPEPIKLDDETRAEVVKVLTTFSTKLTSASAKKDAKALVKPPPPEPVPPTEGAEPPAEGAAPPAEGAAPPAEGAAPPAEAAAPSIERQPLSAAALSNASTLLEAEGRELQDTIRSLEML